MMIPMRMKVMMGSPSVFIPSIALHGSPRTLHRRWFRPPPKRRGINTIERIKHTIIKIIIIAAAAAAASIIVVITAIGNVTIVHTGVLRKRQRPCHNKINHGLWGVWNLSNRKQNGRRYKQSLWSFFINLGSNGVYTLYPRPRKRRRLFPHCPPRWDGTGVRVTTPWPWRKWRRMRIIVLLPIVIHHRHIRLPNK